MTLAIDWPHDPRENGSDPLRGGPMTLAIRWPHEVGENASRWTHEPGDWHGAEPNGTPPGPMAIGTPAGATAIGTPIGLTMIGSPVGPTATGTVPGWAACAPGVPAGAAPGCVPVAPAGGGLFGIGAPTRHSVVNAPAPVFGSGPVSALAA